MADRFAWPAPAPSEPTTPTENPQRGFEHPSRFNLWRPIVVNRTRGSNRLSALPTGSAGMSFSGKFRKTAEFGNSNLWFPNSSPEPAAASGTGHCPAAASIYGGR